VSARGTCPSCGGPVEFRFERAFVTTCPHCTSTVARTDRGLEDLGKRSDLVASESGLEAFTRGRYGGVGFTLMGRTVLAHPKGGRWSEWYAALETGEVAWLSEAQGVFTLLREAPERIAEEVAWATPKDLPPGRELPLGGKRFVVAERSARRTLACEGEVPFVPAFDVDEPFVDLAARDGSVATIDFAGGACAVFVGERVSLADLGIAPRAGARDAHAATTASVACGNCGGPIALAAPSESRRVTCTACGSLHEVEAGGFRFLETLAQPQRPAVSLGTRFSREGASWQIVGWVERSVTSDGVRYPWSEYLAYAGAQGFRWIVESKGHWLWVTPEPNFARPMPADADRILVHDGVTYTRFAHDLAVVDALAGEFPWAVSVGEVSEAMDYACAPRVLSCESDGHELNWSRGEHLDRAEVAQLFPGAALPEPRGVGMVEPNPWRGAWKVFLLLASATFPLLLALVVLRGESKVLTETFPLETMALAGKNASGDGTVFVTEPFELRGDRRVTVTLGQSTAVDAYADFVVDFLDERDVAVESFRAATFAGRDDEGDAYAVPRSENVLGHLPPGRYRLRVDEVSSLPPSDALTVEVVEGGVSVWGWLLTILFLAVGAVPVGVMALLFEGRRFESSDFDSSGLRRFGATPGHGSGDADDASSSDWDDDSTSGDDE
jgi:hypothetical protein